MDLVPFVAESYTTHTASFNCCGTTGDIRTLFIQAGMVLAVALNVPKRSIGVELTMLDHKPLFPLRPALAYIYNMFFFFGRKVMEELAGPRNP
jgi:hypothetical protein